MLRYALTSPASAVYSGHPLKGLSSRAGGPARGYFCGKNVIDSMYAVIKTGGKQYRVTKDDVIAVEKLNGESGDTVEFDQVLMLDDGKQPTVGTPLVDGARVAATVIEQAREPKILVFKKKRRKNYRRTQGHRQNVTILRITDILAKGAKAATAKAKTSAKKDEAKPKAAAKPKAEAKPKAAKPKAEAKPKAAAKPKAKKKDDSDKSKEKS